MLEALEFENFKSWERAAFDCGPITGVFGTNSSGKTSLLQFLLMLKQTKDATDRAISLDLNGDLVKLGTFHDAVFRHEDDRPIKFRIDFRLPSRLSLVNPSDKRTSIIAQGNRLRLRTTISGRTRQVQSEKLSYRLGNMAFRLSRRSEESTQFDLKAVSLGDQENDFAFIRTKGRAWQLPGPMKSYAFPDQARTYYQNAGFLADLESAYENALDRIYYLGPLREFPQRDYLWARSKPTDVGQRGEKTIDAILAATEDNITRNLRPRARHLPFQAMIAHWLREMGLIYSFSINEIAKGSNRWQALIRTRPGASQVLLTDVGFGVSQVLPVITLLQYVPEGSTVLLEQPEIHLHPLAQAALADVIIQAASHRKVQIILESHSEHLLLRLQRRIAEEAISSDVVKLYFCDAPGGVSTLCPLEIDLYGQIRNWPDKFMGDSFNEAASTETARLKRMQATS